MFERFTDRARRVVVVAQEEARLLKHQYIGTEHVLLGLLTERDGVTYQALTSLGIDPAAVRESVVDVIGEGTEAPLGHIPFTPRAKKVLELSLRESLNIGNNYIGTEHILLALVREGEGVAAQVLIRLGADLETMRETVRSLAEDTVESGPSRTHGPTAAPNKFPAMLNRFTRSARTVVAKAEDASRLLNHNYVGTEHLLLGLMADPEAVSARALASHGLDVTAIHGAVVEIVGRGVEGPLVPVRTPFTPRAKGVFEFALRESLKLGRNYVDTEAILLGLIRVGEGIATQVLTALGVDLESLRVTVMELIGIDPESGEPTSPVLWGASPEQRRETCGHHPARLSIEVHDLPSTASDAVAAVRLVVCTACGTTVGVA
jgi:ATP-dependent Clp protease ATP-binding subunit ClpA